MFLDEAVHKRLIAMTTDFGKLWTDPATPNRERKRLLAYIIEDATLIKLPAEGVTKVHVRFKGGKTETLTAENPKSSAEQVKTSPEIVKLVDSLLNDHIYAEIAVVLNRQGFRMHFLKCIFARKWKFISGRAVHHFRSLSASPRLARRC